MAGRAATDTGVNLGADLALILGALGRIEATIRDDRTALGRLRLALGEMARIIARAKAAAVQEAEGGTMALLDELEHRVDAMLDIAATASTPHPEPDRVPTVSGVVSRFTPDPAPVHAKRDSDRAASPVNAQDNVQKNSQDTSQDNAPRKAPNNPQNASTGPRDPAVSPGVTVSMLTAMVEALNTTKPTDRMDTGEADTTAAPQSLPAKPPAAAQPATAPRDPLAPLRAMSEEEIIALFS